MAAAIDKPGSFPDESAPLPRQSATATSDAGLPPGYPFRPEWEATPREVEQVLRSGGEMLLLDCRTPQEHQAARIPGAVLIPMNDFASRLDELNAFRERPVVVHCHHGRRSLRVAAFLRQQGFGDVRSLAGGIDQWSVAIDPRVPRY